MPLGMSLYHKTPKMNHSQPVKFWKSQGKRTYVNESKAQGAYAAVRMLPFVGSVLCSFRCFPFFHPPPAAFPVSCHLPPKRPSALFPPPRSRPPCWVYCPVSDPALVCADFLSKCSPLQDRKFGSVLVSRWFCAVGSWLFEFRFNGLGVCCDSFLPGLLGGFSNGHALFCFTFNLKLKSTTL